MSIENTGDFFYLKSFAESNLGIGTLWIEFTDQRASRQCEKYGERWVCSFEESAPGIGGQLCDQPLSEMEIDPGSIITKEEFETAWAEALSNYRKWPNSNPSIYRYFKKDFNIADRSGTVFFAFKGEKPIQQCEQYGDRWVCSQFEILSGGRIRIIQDTLSSLLQSKDLSIKNEISKDEFDNNWEKALKYYEDSIRIS